LLINEPKLLIGRQHAEFEKEDKQIIGLCIDKLESKITFDEEGIVSNNFEILKIHEYVKLRYFLKGATLLMTNFIKLI
jgi:hypothetical protein